jgi:palmitoyltransferase ZDHHC9/14/18
MSETIPPSPSPSPSLSPQPLDVGSSSAKAAEHVHMYKTWPGQNIFLLGGRLMLGPDWRWLILSLCLVNGPMIVLYATLAKDFSDRFHVLVPLSMALIHAVAVFALLRTATMDPGVVPRAPPEEPLPVDDGSGNPPVVRPKPAAWKEEIIDGVKVQLKYCTTCRIYRPPRATHCGICDNCVHKFDHHCPWTGTCIGERNYRFFALFVWSLSFLDVYCGAWSIALLAQYTIDIENKGSATGADAFGEAVAKVPTTIFVIVWMLLTICCLGGLGCYHCGLTIRGISTNEDIKWGHGHQETKSPYDKGCVKNCASTLCGPMRQQQIELRKLVLKPAPPPRFVSKHEKLNTYMTQNSNGGPTPASGVSRPPGTAAAASDASSKPESQSQSQPSTSSSSSSSTSTTASTVPPLNAMPADSSENSSRPASAGQDVQTPTSVGHVEFERSLSLEESGMFKSRSRSSSEIDATVVVISDHASNGGDTHEAAADGSSGAQGQDNRDSVAIDVMHPMAAQDLPASP